MDSKLCCQLTVIVYVHIILTHVVYNIFLLSIHTFLAGHLSTCDQCRYVLPYGSTYSSTALLLFYLEILSVGIQS